MLPCRWSTPQTNACGRHDEQRQTVSCSGYPRVITRDKHLLSLFSQSCRHCIVPPPSLSPLDETHGRVGEVCWRQCAPLVVLTLAACRVGWLPVCGLPALPSYLCSHRRLAGVRAWRQVEIVSSLTPRLPLLLVFSFSLTSVIWHCQTCCPTDARYRHAR